MEALCRDCLTWFGHDPGRRCPACGSPRCVAHPELGTLSIAHVDCDAFYASVEKRDDPRLADRPVIIGGGRRGVVATACYIARIRGVRSAMPMFRALELCPGAVVIRPRIEVYAAVSRRIRAMMLALTPRVEPLSLDEAFLDLSGTARLHGAPPALVLARLQTQIAAEVGVTVSVGLSHNRFLAKMASEIDKPRGFAVVGVAGTAAFLGPRPVSDIWGVGRALHAALAAWGIDRIADLRRLDRAVLVARHGAIGARLHDLAHGRDPRTVSPDRETRSISAETTFEHDLADRETLSAQLWRLCVRVSDRLKATDAAAGVVTLKLRRADFTILTRRTVLDAPSQLADTLFRAADPLLTRTLAHAPFRLIGVGASALSAADAAAQSTDLFDHDAAARARVERATDAIRQRFGPDAIIRGRALPRGTDAAS